MQKVRPILNKFGELFSDTHQLQRIVIYLGIALVLAVLSFGSYYYYDRYYTNEPDIMQQSLAEAEQAVRDDPQSVPARLALADAYLLNIRYDDALAQANQVMNLESDNQHAWLVAGISYANTGRPSEAIDPLTKFMEARQDEEMPGLDKQLHAAGYFLGDSYLQLGQPESAIEPLEKVVIWSQTDADSLYKLGMAYSGIQDYENALVVFYRAIAFVPNFREVYEAMANVYDAMGKPDEASFARGMVAYSEQDYDAALSMLLVTVQAQPAFSPAFVGLGLTYEAMDDLNNAKANYETAALLDPNNFTANQGVLRTEAALKK